MGIILKIVIEGISVRGVSLRRSKRIKERECKRRAVLRKKKPSKTDKIAHVFAHIHIPITAFRALP